MHRQIVAREAALFLSDVPSGCLSHVFSVEFIPVQMKAFIHPKQSLPEKTMPIFLMPESRINSKCCHRRLAQRASFSKHLAPW